jgi:hypothetical protein
VENNEKSNQTDAHLGLPGDARKIVSRPLIGSENTYPIVLHGEMRFKMKYA